MNMPTEAYRANNDNNIWYSLIVEYSFTHFYSFSLSLGYGFLRCCLSIQSSYQLKLAAAASRWQHSLKYLFFSYFLLLLLLFRHVSFMPSHSYVYDTMMYKVFFSHFFRCPLSLPLIYVIRPKNSVSMHIIHTSRFVIIDLLIYYYYYSLKSLSPLLLLLLLWLS